MHTRIFTSDSLQPSPLARQEGRRKLVSINDERVGSVLRYLPRGAVFQAR
jgi:hypothetical protein